MKDKVTCADRIREALAKKGMTQADLCRATHIPTSAMSQYCNGTLTPRQKRTEIIAEALSVSVGWLMGFDVPSEPDIGIATSVLKSGVFVEPPINRSDIPSNAFASDEESELLRIYRILAIKGKTKLLAYAYELESEKED